MRTEKPGHRTGSRTRFEMKKDIYIIQKNRRKKFPTSGESNARKKFGARTKRDLTWAILILLSSKSVFQLLCQLPVAIGAKSNY